MIIVQPNPALERTVNGGAARWFHQNGQRRCRPLSYNVGPQMQVNFARFLLEGQEVCVASNVMVSAFKVVADELAFPGSEGASFQAGLLAGEKFPVIVYLGDGKEKVAGEAFMYSQTSSRLHVGIWKSYLLNSSTNRWEG